MNDTSRFLVVHGLPIIFGAVFLDQMGVPIPAAPWLLAAGALAAAGKFHWFMAILLSILACLIADFFWFYLGRYRGTQVVAVLCRMSLEPDTCVRKTVNVFTRYGYRGIIVAKFVPGMSTVTPPLAGMAGISAGRFLLFDGLSSVLYSSAFILLGYIFSNQIAQIAAALNQFGGGLLTIIVILVALYLLYKFWDRQRILRELRTAKITPAELGQMLNAGGEPPIILDVRPVLELEQDPAIIRGAMHLAMEDLEARQKELSRDREIVIYCDCPNEASSAKTALLLRRKGFTRVRPLLGGIDAWRKGNYPTDVWAKTTGAATTTVVVNNEQSSPAKDAKETSRTE
ncbi:MAG TPA: DedA family protein/thiosulfate sulfurtransferase GlpE [Candidatus Sulfotelmatobacter sp.]|nr:DedA family protein/thiosulfate sulfurtransferase GlpE [Candidatus Sulfotelmatobacter sp.]